MNIIDIMGRNTLSQQVQQNTTDIQMLKGELPPQPPFHAYLHNIVNTDTSNGSRFNITIISDNSTPMTSADLIKYLYINGCVSLATQYPITGGIYTVIGTPQTIAATGVYSRDGTQLVVQQTRIDNSTNPIAISVVGVTYSNPSSFNMTDTVIQLF